MQAPVRVFLWLEARGCVFFVWYADGCLVVLYKAAREVRVDFWRGIYYIIRYEEKET